MFDTKYPITWCPGCPNHLILASIKKALSNLVKQGVDKDSFVMSTDIGCNSKIYDYLNISGLYGLHGRAIPVAVGASIANPKLKILAISGDGGAYDEGTSHFVHACRYNTNMTLMVHNNQIFSLTTGQATATTEAGFVEKTHPFGVKEKPINPVLLALTLGATFVARASALDINPTARIIEEAIKHKGFSFIDVLQPCLIFHNSSEFLRKNSYYIKPMKLEKAIKAARKWEYTASGKVPLGIFYKVESPSFREKYGKKG